MTPTGGGSFNHAFSGPLIPQVAGPFSLQSDLSGNLIGLGGGSSFPSIPNLDIAANFNGVSSYSFEVDLTSSNLSLGSGGQVPDFATSDAFVLDDATLGRGRIRLIGGLFGDTNTFAADIASYYFIGPNQFVAIGLGPQPNGTAGGPSSGILFFDPQ